MTRRQSYASMAGAGLLSDLDIVWVNPEIMEAIATNPFEEWDIEPYLDTRGAVQITLKIKGKEFATLPLCVPKETTGAVKARWKTERRDGRKRHVLYPEKVKIDKPIFGTVTVNFKNGLISYG